MGRGRKEVIDKKVEQSVATFLKHVAEINVDNIIPSKFYLFEKTLLKENWIIKGDEKIR